MIVNIHFSVIFVYNIILLYLFYCQLVYFPSTDNESNVIVMPIIALSMDFLKYLRKNVRDRINFKASER